MQDTIRITRNFTLNAGIRYDLQTFEPGPLVSNPLYPASGRSLPHTNNFAPRIGFGVLNRDKHPTVIRGGGGLFYMPIPAMYAAQVATDNGIQQSSLFLNLMGLVQAALFPSYPSPLANCPPGTLVCNLPKSLAGLVTTDISAFAPNFQTPYTEQANLTVQHQFGDSIVATVSYAYVRGMHEIRSLMSTSPSQP